MISVLPCFFVYDMENSFWISFCDIKTLVDVYNIKREKEQYNEKMFIFSLTLRMVIGIIKP